MRDALQARALPCFKAKASEMEGKGAKAKVWVEGQGVEEVHRREGAPEREAAQARRRGEVAPSRVCCVAHKFVVIFFYFRSC